MPRKANSQSGSNPHTVWLDSLHPALRTLVEWDSWPFVSGGTLLIACSGGKDSVALAHSAWTLLCTDPHRTEFAKHLRLKFGLTVDLRLPSLAIWHYDHGLRSDSAQDATLVRRLAAQLDARFILAEGRLREHAEFGKANTMALARQERYAELSRQVLSESRLDPVALSGGGVSFPQNGCCALLAHHCQDQAETLLLNLVRGAGLPGMSGMAPWAPALSTFRPWLDLTPEWIADYAQRQNLTWREDPTNANTDYARSLIRHKVLPLLRDLNSAAVTHLARSALYAGEATAFLRAYGASLAAYDLAPFIQGKLPLAAEPPAAYGIVSLPNVPLYTLEMWLALEQIVQRWLGDTSNTTADEFRRWLARPEGKLSLGGGTFNFYDGWLDFTTTPVPAPEPHTELLGPLGHNPIEVGLGQATLRKSRLEATRTAALAAKERHITWDSFLEDVWEESAWLARSTAQPEPMAVNGKTYKCYLPSTVALPLHFRTRRTGDRIALAGQAGGRRMVSDIFIDKKIPAYLRDLWLLLVDADDNVLWIPGLANSAAMHQAVTDGSAYVVNISRHHKEIGPAFLARLLDSDEP